MKVARSVAEILSQHTTLVLECIDRLYLNVYVPVLQSAAGAAYFFRKIRGCSVPSSVLMAPMTRRFVDAIKSYAERDGLDIVSFRRGERKDDRMQELPAAVVRGRGRPLHRQGAGEGAGAAHRAPPQPGHRGTCAWLVDSTAMVNHFYFYAVDDDFGPFFLKFCSYFPYNAKLCINGHEYLKRQLTKRGIAFEPLDNGIRSCADPEAMQRLADGLTADKIDALLRKWLARLPHPFEAGDREQGIRYDISVLQAEFARTEVFDRPVQGRIFFEEVLRENLDMGRPDHVQLIFNRRVSRRTPTRYRTRVITDGVIPSLHLDYKRSRIKQYYKEGRALRTETVINDTYDFGIGRRLRNLDDLKKIGFAANRRLLGVQTLSHDCTIGADVLDGLHRPAHIDGQRASALRFGDPRVQALCAALLQFDLLPHGFRNRELRETVAPLCGLSLEEYGPGRMTYDLRRLRLRGIIVRIPDTQRYQLTAEGLCIALAYHRTQARVLGPVLSATLDGESTTRLHEAVALYDREVGNLWEGQALAA